MSLISDVEHLVSEVKAKLYPTGDPEAIRTAAGEWTSLASQILGMRQHLTSVASGLNAGWHGTESSYDKTASVQFQHAWETLSKEMDEYAQYLQSGAQQLNAIAEQIEITQQQAARLREILETTVIAELALAAVLWFYAPVGVETAAADAALIGGEADTMLGTLANVLRLALGTLEDFGTQLLRVAGRFAIGSVVSGWLPEALTKELQGQNPFDLNNYTLPQLGNIALSGLLGSYMLTALDDVPLLKAFSENGFSDVAGKIPFFGKFGFVKFLAGGTVAGTAAFGLTGGTLGSILSQKWVQNESVNWGDVGLSALVSGGIGTVFGAGQAKYEAFRTSKLPAGSEPYKLPTAGSYLVKNGVGVGSGMLFFVINYPKGSPFPGAPGQPNSSFTDPAAAAPPTVTFVKSGDTLLGITDGNWKEIGAIANANEVGNVNLIFPKEEFIVPPASSWPSHAQLPSLGSAHAVTVQPGQTLWSIAGGNEEKMAEIARLNGLSNPNAIQAGQTLKLPS